MKKKVVCIAQPSLIRAYFRGDQGDQIFVICKKGGEFVMGKKVKLRKKFLAWVDMDFIKYTTEEDKMFESKKMKIGMGSAFGIPIVGLLALHFLTLPVEAVLFGMGCATAIVCAHVIGHSITDAAVHFGVGKKK